MSALDDTFCTAARLLIVRRSGDYLSELSSPAAQRVRFLLDDQPVAGARSQACSSLASSAA